MRFLIPLLATVRVSFTAAMIEAPIRLYVTENLDGTATPSYKIPTTVFAPHIAESGAPLASIAAKLDQIFQRISKAAGS